MFTASISVVASDYRIKGQIAERGWESFRATGGSAAYDLHGIFTSEGSASYTLAPGETKLVDTGLSIHIRNPGFCALVLPRSGLASKRGLAPINSPGLIDSDYQGPLKVALHNFSSEPQTVEDFERIAQLLFIPVVTVNAELMPAHVDATQRGAGGFGSTG